MARDMVSTAGYNAAQLYVSSKALLGPDVAFQGSWPTADGAVGAGAVKHLRLKESSRDVSYPGNNRAIETFVVVGDPTDAFLVAELGNPPSPAQAARSIIRALERLEALFHSAQTKADVISPVSEIRLYEKLRSEERIRYARIYSGSITPLDKTVATRDLNRGVAEYLITIERDAHWSQGGGKTESGTLRLWNNGGHTRIWSPQSGPADGLIDLSVYSSAGGNLNRVWTGIKLNTGATSGSLVNWDPTITVNASSVSIQPNHSTSVHGETDSKLTGFVGDKGIAVRYNKPAGWNWAFRIPIYRWNAYASTQANRQYYQGKYKLLIRWKSANISDLTYGIQAGVGWAEASSVTELSRNYQTYTDGDFQYLDAGEFEIGGPLSSDMTQRSFLQQYSIWISCAVFGDYNRNSTSDFIFFDDFVLMPLDKTLFWETERTLSAGERAEIYQDNNGQTYGFITEDRSGDGTPVGEVQNTLSPITDSIDYVSASNWTWPRSSAGHQIVLVGEKAAGTGTKYKDSWTDVTFRYIKRGAGPFMNREAHQVI